MTEPTWTTTRSQLTDALANIEVRVKLSGPMARKVVAEDMAEAILSQLPQDDGSVTVSREDLRAVLRVTPGSAWLAGTGYAAAMAARRRLTEALRAPDSLGHGEPYRDMAQDPGERTEALRAAEEFLP